MSIISDIADTIESREAEFHPCMPTVEKELVHMEILAAMREAGLFEHLAFKGGTCLRLCRRGSRLSEDLDFSGPPDFDAQSLANGDFGSQVQHRLMSTLGVDSELLTKGEPRHGVTRMIVRVVLTPRAKGTRERIQRVKIEIDDRLEFKPPVAQAETPYLGYGLPTERLIIRAVSLNDTMADKLGAFPQSLVEWRNPRYRDAWDLLNHLPSGSAGRLALTEGARRLASRVEDAPAMLEAASARLDEAFHSATHEQTMRRFLPSSEADAYFHRDTVHASADRIRMLFSDVGRMLETDTPGHGRE